MNDGGRMRMGWRHWFATAIAAALLLSFAGYEVTRAAQPTHNKPTVAGKPPGQTKPKPLPTPQAPPPPGTALDTEAKHAIIIEVETGTVLLNKYADERMPPASMSKIMTAYVVFGMLKDGKVKLTDELPVSEKAWKLGGSKMFVGIGARVTVENLIQGMLIQSGNDACIVLAEGLAGSEPAFVDLMNQKAPEIGLKDSHFGNVTGLPDPNDWMTAQDLATLAIRTIRDFPEYYHYFSEKDFNFNNIDQGNRNPLLYRNIGADGLKTGHTDESGYSLTASVVRGDRRVIVVVSGLPSMKDRASESERLVEWAFREFNDYKLFSAGDKVDDAEVWLGTDPKVGLTIDKDLTITLPRRSRRDLKVTVAYDGPIAAPVKKGDQIGKLVVSAPDIQPIERPLFAAASVPPIGTFGRMATLAAYLIWGSRH
ncbi:MAG TPA: D-alanyl-D-alanine carboxypeptidase family protein [Stellaceae bacterium]|nr:D-alanyl-D-alanine carboxypeptidase family protein [Stellaceae bacterium]